MNRLPSAPAGALEAEEGIWLDPSGALVLPQAGLAVVSDLHLGKATQFRREGLAVPEGSDDKTCGRLQNLVSRWGLQRLVIAGDFLHGPRASSPSLAETWRSFLHGSGLTRVDLVEGNHDRSAGRGVDWRTFDLEPEAVLTLAPETTGLGQSLVVIHEPQEEAGLAATAQANPGQMVMYGHLHPAVRLGGGGGQRLRVKCFLRSPLGWCTPAFGEFTGGWDVASESCGVVYPCDGLRVHGPIGLPLERRWRPRG